MTRRARAVSEFRRCHHRIRGLGFQRFGNARFRRLGTDLRYRFLLLRRGFIHLAVEAVDRLLDAIDRIGIDSLDRFQLLRGHTAQLLYRADVAFHQRIHRGFRETVLDQG